MNKLFQFGENVAGYDYRVINEREARASAGIMFLLGLISLVTVFGAFGQHTLFWAEMFSITFIVEFIIRILVNPRYAPYMILGGLIVSSQHPEWVEAKPKKFAWVLGLMLGIVMAYFIIFEIMHPMRMISCVLCLLLLYLESAFGICLGCILYAKINVKLEGNCPGGACAAPAPKRFYLKHILVLLASIGLFYTMFTYVKSVKYPSQQSQQMLDEMEMMQEDEAEEDSENMQNMSQKAPSGSISSTKNKDCTVPQFAIDMGHEEIWKKHNGCK